MIMLPTYEVFQLTITYRKTIFIPVIRNTLAKKQQNLVKKKENICCVYSFRWFKIIFNQTSFCLILFEFSDYLIV